MIKHSPFRYFKTSPEIIRLAVMLYVRFPLSLRNVEYLKRVFVCLWTAFGTAFWNMIYFKLLIINVFYKLFLPCGGTTTSEILIEIPWVILSRRFIVSHIPYTICRSGTYYYNRRVPIHAVNSYGHFIRQHHQTPHATSW